MPTPAALQEADKALARPERLAEFARAVAADQPGDTEELAMYLEFYALAQPPRAQSPAAR